MGDAMQDDEKTREQLVHELPELRSQNVEMEKSITGTISAVLAIEEARRYAKSILGNVSRAPFGSGRRPENHLGEP